MSAKTIQDGGEWDYEDMSANERRFSLREVIF